MPEIDNLLGSTRRVVEEQEPLNNCRGVTYRVVNVDGGGGGSVDYTKVVSKTDSMPVASADNADIIYLYDGETDATYTHGYIYENVPTTTSSSASAAQTVGSGLSDIAVDLETLESFTGWTTDNSLQIFYTEDGWSVDATSLGVTYTGTPSVGDAITITYTAAVTTYSWVRIDVQPTPEVLPSQSGQSGKFLTTDGTNASWGSINALENIGTGTNSVVVSGSTDAGKQRGVALGRFAREGEDSVSVGYTALGSGIPQAAKSVFVGSQAQAANPNKTGIIAIGYKTSINGNYGIAIGTNAKANGVNSIQLGAKDSSTGWTNTDANTFKVGNANGNFELMNATGNIPADRIASTTGLADGNYRLRLTMASGVPTLSWVAE